LEFAPTIEEQELVTAMLQEQTPATAI